MNARNDMACPVFMIAFDEKAGFPAGPIGTAGPSGKSGHGGMRRASWHVNIGLPLRPLVPDGRKRKQPA
ncbi:hypothetical protein CFR71_06420 [Novacetimonas pomaceti]|uniref:Uncharacterized protein n=1 Tax=Novacetimonas pomaceti TaxID=2021998 RepID=A0A318QBR9_9PROT|nr:hypothetical protein CFR71_06420 [Novacetimonas pomaceti]